MNDRPNPSAEAGWYGQPGNYVVEAYWDGGSWSTQWRARATIHADPRPLAPPPFEAKRVPIDPQTAAISSNLVRIVAVFYAVVLGQAVTTRYNVVLNPLRDSFSVCALTLLVAVVGAGWQYLRLSNNIERFPYDVRWSRGGSNRTGTEELRFACDFLTAAGYAVILVEGFTLKDNESKNIAFVLVTFAAVNVLSYISTWLLGRHWKLPKRWATLGRPKRYATPLALWPLALMAIYLLCEHHIGSFKIHQSGWNILFLLIATGVLNGWELLERSAVKELVSGGS